MKYLGITAVGALLVASFAYFALFSGPTLPVPVESPDAARLAIPEAVDPTLMERTAFAGTGSLNNLIARGESIECQITYIPNPLEPEVTGTFFVANGNVRADFLVPSPDLAGQVLSSIIFDGSAIYVWSEINEELFGFTVATDSFMTDQSSDTSPIPADTELQYNCLTWPAVDFTIFEPPTSVLFTDLTDFTATMETGLIFEEEG